MTCALTNRNTCLPAGNRYKVYPQPELPGADCFLWLMLWIRWLERVHYQRPLAPDDPIFPAMGANGIVQPCLAISSDTVQQWINEATTGAGISGSFSTHCFRRRGAQYRFILGRAGRRWSLKKVNWWGGWAEGENVSFSILNTWRPIRANSLSSSSTTRSSVISLTSCTAMRRTTLTRWRRSNGIQKTPWRASLPSCNPSLRRRSA